MPGAKYLQDLLGYFPVTITSTANPDPALYNTPQDAFNAIKGSVSDIQGMIPSTGMSLPSGIIFIDPSGRPGGINEFNALFIHEVFHQFQYEAHGGRQAFEDLIREMWDNKFKSGYDSYIYKDHFSTTTKDPQLISDLQQIKTMEGQAEFIEDLIRTYYMLNPNHSTEHSNMAYSNYLTVIKNQNSGINTGFRL
jgi:hypothetical protein